MSKIAGKVAKFIETHLEWFLLAGAAIAGIVIRASFKEVQSLDMTGDYVLWAEELKTMSLSEALRTPVGNYSSLYQLMLYVLAKIPVFSVATRIKAVSCVFDYLIAGLFYVIARKEFRTKLSASLAASLVLLSPVVFMNSAAWGQCDSIFTFFALFSIYLLWKEKRLSSFLLLGVAFMWKFQTLFFVPIYLMMYLRDKKWSLLWFLAVPAVMFLMYLPNLIAGRPLSMLFGVYSDQAGILPNSMYVNYSNIYALFTADQEAVKLGSFASIGAIFFAIGAVAVLMVLIFRKKRPDTFDDFLFASLLLYMTVVMFLPRMHDRYGYGAEVLALLLVLRNRKAIVPTVLLYVTTLFHYGLCLFQYAAMPLYVVTLLHLASYAGFLAVYFKNTGDEAKGAANAS